MKIEIEVNEGSGKVYSGAWVGGISIDDVPSKLHALIMTDSKPAGICSYAKAVASGVYVEQMLESINAAPNKLTLMNVAKRITDHIINETPELGMVLASGRYTYAELADELIEYPDCVTLFSSIAKRYKALSC